MEKKIKANMHKGIEAPVVELTAQELEGVDGSCGRVSIMLQRLEHDLHNQSYGMVSCSTGCVSNPGGPSC